MALFVALANTSLAPAEQEGMELKNQVTLVNTGQKWSDAQNEIWRIVQAYWVVPTAEGLMEYFHPEFMGWSTREAMPHDKPTCRLWNIDSYNTRKTKIIAIAPTGLRIHGNVAIVNYYYTWWYVDEEGETEIEKGRFTDVLMKEAGKWLLIADHGGPSHEEDD
jgi:hypothetical protein